MKKANTVSAIIGIIISACAIAVTFTFKQFKNVPIGPEFFPRLMAIGLLVCSIILLVQSIKSTSTEPAPSSSLKEKGMQRMLIGLAIFIVYAMLWQPIGFPIITPFLLFGFMFLLNYKKYPLMIVLSICISTGIFLIFRMLLGIDMPLGLLKGFL